MYFGPDMVIDEEIALSGPDSPFLLQLLRLQYATGYSAAIALSRRILTGGRSAVQDTRLPLRRLQQEPHRFAEGRRVDMTSPEPVNQALELFGELLDEMEQLMQD